MNVLFAQYDPEDHGSPLTEAEVSLATADDLAETGALAARREGAEPADWVRVHARKFDDPAQRLFVARVEGRVVGFGWVAHLTPSASGGHGAPDGWYLNGLVVAPELRRRGLGLRLTCARIAWALERADEVFYVVAGSNRASRRMHELLGFRELTTDFALPGAVFGNGDGILCRLGRDDGADVIDLAAWAASRGR